MLVLKIERLVPQFSNFDGWLVVVALAGNRLKQPLQALKIMLLRY